LWWSFIPLLRNHHNWLYSEGVMSVRNFQLVCLGQGILRKADTNGRLLRSSYYVRGRRRSSGLNSDRYTQANQTKNRKRSRPDHGQPRMVRIRELIVSVRLNQALKGRAGRKPTTS
jgi:hypothetical protein